MAGALYKRAYYKYLDILRKFGFWYRRTKYSFHPDIRIGKKVRIGKNVSIEVLYGGKITIGDNTEILDGCLVWTYGGEIEIGKNCSINPMCIIYGQGNTKIGNDVLIAGQTMVIPSNHNFRDALKLIREQGVIEKGIVIEDNVWIAHGCSILDGIVIEKGAVIAAGSVVNKSIKGYTVNGGIPAKQLSVIENK